MVWIEITEQRSLRETHDRNTPKGVFFQINKSACFVIIHYPTSCLPMITTRCALLLTLLLCQWSGVRSQTLPPFLVDRRMDGLYMDSISSLAKHQYKSAAAMPATARTDSIQFEALYYLGRLYNWWENRQDSSIYFADILVKQAYARQNVEFEVKAMLVKEFYYRDLRANYPEALRLNYQARAVLQKARQDPRLLWRIELNLGELYTLSEEYDNALKFLNNAQILLAKGSGVSPQTTVAYRADIEEKLGIIYEEQRNFKESERHYLVSERILVETGMGAKTNLGFIYQVLSALYLRMGDYQKVLVYAKKAEPLWESLHEPASITTNWSMLAMGYAHTGQNGLGLAYARKVFNHKQPTLVARQQAYLAIHIIYENQKNWQQSLFYYKRYVALSDTARNAVQSRKLASMNQKSVLDQLASQRQREQQTFIRETQQQQQIRLGLLVGLTTLLLFTVALGLSYRKIQRQQHQIQQLNTGLERTVQTRTAELLTTNDELRRANQAIREADARIILTQETERQRIAADLHDDLGGTLSTLRRRLADIRQHVQDPRAARQLDDLEPMIQKSSADLRRIAHNLMPPEFTRLGLYSALEQLVNSQPAQPTHFTFISSGREQKLPVDTELNVYRIVSELVQNVNKHARARRAAVQLLYQNDRLVITVEDDGIGKKGATPTNEAIGIGLKTSKLRAEYIGATLWRDPSEGGTLVVLDVPYQTPDVRPTTYPDSAG